MVGKNFKALTHFNRLSEYVVQCKHCDKTLSSKHTSSNLTRHLIRNHKPLARTIFAGEEGRMLAELREELDPSNIHMDSVEIEGETRSAVRAITGHVHHSPPEPELRNKVIGKNNKLWIHFHRISEFMARCKHCSKTLSSKHSSSNLMRHIVRRHQNLVKTLSTHQPHRKEAMMLTVDRQQMDPLEKVDFDDVDSIIEKVTDQMDEEEPFYEYVVENTDEVEVKDGQPMHQNYVKNARIIESEIDNESRTFIDSTTQLDEKLKAETIYYNEMAELARSKRRLIDLQAKKLLIELNLSDT